MKIIIMYLTVIILFSVTSFAQAPDDTSGQPTDLQPAAEKTKPPTKNTRKRGRSGVSIKKSTQFFKPVTVQADSKDDNKVRVYFSGKTLPGARIYLGSKKISILGANRKISKLPISEIIIQPPLDPNAKTPQKALRNIRVKANHLGYFNFELLLPTEKLRLPIKVRYKRRRKKYSLMLKVSPEVVEAAGKKLADSPLIDKKYGVWFGLGANYLQYSQDASFSGTQRYALNYTSFQPKAMMLNGFWKVNNNWELQGSYNIAPGKTQTSSVMAVNQGDYNWTIASLDAIWFMDSWRNTELNMFGKWNASYGIMFGYQMHTVPFIKRSAEKIADIATTSVNMVTLGGIARFTRDYKWFYEIFMRYQNPISTGDLFEISSAMAFDGSVGVSYQYSQKWRYGLFWYGQSQNINYEKAVDYDSSLVSGKQNLFFSNFELRAGIHW